MSDCAAARRPGVPASAGTTPDAIKRGKRARSSHARDREIGRAVVHARHEEASRIPEEDGVA